jgi:beta-phosphoglucomutase-like phosphatase (HAD superfamily)
MKQAAFLFDMDGTLIDSEVVWGVAILRWLRSFGEDVTETELMDLISGRSWADNHKLLHSRFSSLPNTTLAEDSKELKVYFNELVSDPAQLIISSTVDFLKKVSAFVPCAIVSGSPRKDVLDAIEYCGLSNNVKFALGGEDYPLGKPAPDGYLKAAGLLGVNPENCIVVEDSVPGVASGLAAGMKVIALNRHNAPADKFEGCSWLVKDLSEIDIEEVLSTAR